MLFHSLAKPLRRSANVTVPTYTVKRIDNVTHMFSWQNILVAGVEDLSRAEAADRLTAGDWPLRCTLNTATERQRLCSQPWESNAHGFNPTVRTAGPGWRVRSMTRSIMGSGYPFLVKIVYSLLISSARCSGEQILLAQSVKDLIKANFWLGAQ